MFVSLRNGKKKGEFENLKEEVELFHRSPSFSELVRNAREKFDGEFTLK